MERNVGVNLAWENIAKNIPNDDLKNVLKQQVIAKWIDIRTRSFVKCFVQIIKRNLNNLIRNKKEEAKKKSVSLTTEPALRKTLH